MLEVLGLDISAKFLVFLMLSFSFFVGIILLVSSDAFRSFNQALQKEYGLKRRIAPQLEDARVDFVDRVLIKYRLMAGLLICIAAFFLLLLYK